MKRTFNVYGDPGHAWLRVSRAQLMHLGIGEKISRCSYQRGRWVYLEEDLDAGIFLNAFKATGAVPKIKGYYTNRQSRIRSYDHYAFDLIDAAYNRVIVVKVGA